MQSVRLIITLSVPLCIGLFLLAEPFTALYFGPAFSRVQLDIKILAFYPFIKSYSLYLQKQILLPFGQDKEVVKGLLAGCIVLITCFIVLCPVWQDAGAGISLVLSEIVTTIYFTWWLGKKYPRMPLFDFIYLLKAIAGSLLFIPVIYCIDQMAMPAILQFVTMLLICMIVYFSVQMTVLKNQLLLNIYKSFCKAIRMS
jgi:O-antigen/teichoic acid export membrane protein